MSLWSFVFTISLVNSKPHRYDYSTGLISSDPVQQAEQTMVNIAAALKEAGSSVDEVVRVRYIVPRKEDFKEMWPVLRKWFGEGEGEGTEAGRKGPRPAATMVSCGLVEEAMKVEIEVTARKGSALGGGDAGDGVAGL